MPSYRTVVTYSNLDQADLLDNGAGNISVQPIFVDETDPDPENWDFRLGASSPGIDAGNNAVPDVCGTDLNGSQRFLDDPLVTDTGIGSGSIVDMGAYERQTGSVADEYNLTMAAVGNGTTLPAVGVHNYPACTTVNLYAIAEGDSWMFESWSGNVADSANSATAIAMTGDQGVTANFKQAVTLTVEIQGTGTGSITSVPAGIDCGSDCSEIYDANTQVTLSAAIDSGSIFEGWIGGGCAGTGSCLSDLTEETKIVGIISLEGSCGHGDELLLENVDADADNTLQACSSVTVGNGVNIVAPSTVEIIAGDYVELTGEFAVASGAVLSVQTGP